MQLEREVIKPVIPPQTCIAPEAKGMSQGKPRLGQGRAGIKTKMLKLPVSHSYDKLKQPKLLPGRKPIIQIAEKRICNNLKILYSLKQV